MDDGGGTAGTSADQPAPGWYRDPAGHADLRWWTGQSWSEATRAAEPHAVAPRASEQATPTDADSAPTILRPGAAPTIANDRLDPPRSRAEWRRVAASRRGIRTESPNTFAIWVLAFLPIITVGYSAATVLVWREASIWAVLALQLTGVLVYLALIVWDKVALARQRMLAPSLWWQLIPIPLLYFLLRRIILKKQGVISHAPGNAYVIVLVASAALSAVTVQPLVMQSTREIVAQQIENRIAADFAEVGETAVADCPPSAVLTPGARLECSVDIADGRLTIPIQFEVQPDLTTVPVQYSPLRGFSG